ncbi:hypothetical protein AWV80_23365 [Cupriavidus sp. UYMU48A]|nr:hypothetical protein AWV80_23365 [Cupriavidus sp. UYMU48A]
MIERQYLLQDVDGQTIRHNAAESSIEQTPPAIYWLSACGEQRCVETDETESAKLATAPNDIGDAFYRTAMHSLFGYVDQRLS